MRGWVSVFKTIDTVASLIKTSEQTLGGEEGAAL